MTSSHSADAYDAAQDDPREPRRKNKPGAGRPKEGRVRVNVCILPATHALLRAAKGKDGIGKVIDGLVAQDTAGRMAKPPA